MEALLANVENEISQTKEALENVQGTPTEVYARIVGYYRSVRNWNKGKRAEFGDRTMFSDEQAALAPQVASVLMA